MRTIFATWIILLFLPQCQAYLYEAILYTLPSWKGESIHFFNNSCANIPPEYLKGSNGGISSINTTDTCVVLYADTNCQGYMTIVKPATIGHIDLNKVGFDNRALSIGPCDGICTMNNVVERRERAEIIERDMPSEIVAMISLFCTVGVFTTVCNATLFMVYIRQLRNDRRDGQRHRPLPLLPMRTSTDSLKADYNEYEEPKLEQHEN